MNKSSALMTEGNIAQKIILFALPIFLGNLFQQLYNTADSLIVGNFLGSNALAAVSSSGNLIGLLVGLFQGIAMGGSVVIARNFGAKNHEEVTKAVHTTVVFGLISGIVLTIIGVIFAPHILIMMSTPKDVIEQSTAYFSMYFLGSIGFVMYNIFVGILQAVGDSKHPLYYLIISSLTNIVLDYIFIGVLGYGVEAAALATVIAQFLSALLCFVQLMHAKDSCRIYINKLKIDKEILKKVIVIGLPAGIQNSIISFANVFIQSHINSFGTLAMAGCGAYSKIEGFAFLPITSFSMALTTFVGQNLGANQQARARKGAIFGLTCAMIVAQIIGILMYLFAPIFLSAFDSNPEVLAYGIARARTASLFYFLLAFSHGVSSVLRGAGNSALPMVVMLVCWCIVRVSLLSVVMPFYHDIRILYWIYPFTWGLSTLTYALYLRYVPWLKKTSFSN